VRGEKRPAVKNWQRLGTEPISWADTEQMFNETDSIGIVWGTMASKYWTSTPSTLTATN
jgi:hypothetical protein